MFLVQIPKDKVIDMAPLARVWLEKVIPYSRGKLTVDDVIQQAADGDLQMWMCGRYGEPILGVLVTQLRQYARKKVAEIFMLAGTEMRSWIHLTEQVERWAKRQGCESVMISGRKGWGKILPDYELAGHLFEKELSDG